MRGSALMTAVQGVSIVFDHEVDRSKKLSFSFRRRTRAERRLA